MKVIDLIKALFFPRDMKKLRYMSVLFAICLFVLEMYLIVCPANSYYRRTTHDLVVENDLYYLQSILNIKETESLSSLVKELQSKNIRSGSVELTDYDLAFDSLNIDSSDGASLGILQKNSEETEWLFNNANTSISVNGDDKPEIKFTDDGIILNNVSNKKILFEGISETDKPELVIISCTDKGELKINGKTYDILVRSSSPTISIKDNNIYFDGEYTGCAVNDNAKVVYYFIPNNNVYYYTREYTYTNENGVVNHLNFVINTKAESLNDVLVEYSDTEFPNIKDDDYYFITIASSFVSYQANPKGIEDLEITRGDKTLQTATVMVPYSNAGEFTFDGLKVENFSEYLLGKLEIGYQILAASSIKFQMFIYCIVFTLIVTLLFSLLFKKNGRLKTFKEYYNIASLANIIPSIIAFIMMWINPVLVGSSYLFIFSVYYLFVLYRINNSPEIV